MKSTRDELLERYADAVAQDASRPSTQVREAVHAHADMLARARAPAPSESQVTPRTHAANQSRWAVSLLASLAVVGLSTLLMLQIERGSPEDRDVALGARPPAQTEPTPSAKPAPVSVATTGVVAPRPANPEPARGAAESRHAPEPRLARARESEAQPQVPQAHTKALDAGAPQTTMADNGPVPAVPTARTDSVANVAQQKAFARPMLEGQVVAPAPAPAPAPAARARDADLQAATPAVQFMDAVRNGHIAIAEALVHQGLSVNTRDTNGDTALMVAVAHRQAGMVAKLLTLGADTRMVNREGFTALDLARRSELDGMVQLLQAPR